MANSGTPRKPGSGNRRPPGTGNRSAATRRSGAPASAKPASAGGGAGNDDGSERLSADERARERLSQPKAGTKRPPPRSNRSGGKIDPRRRRPPQRSTGRTAGIFGGAFVALAIVVIILISTLGGSSTTGKVGSPLTFKAAPAAYVTAITSVSAAQLNAGGTGNGQESPSVFVATPPAKQPALTATVGGKTKPVLLYMGAEYCPYCAASRWPLIIALSRFGTFKGLGIIGSSPEDVFASTRTWSFAKATYTSPYLVFDPVELVSNVCAVALVSNACPNENYTRIKPGATPAQAKLFQTYDSAPYFTTTQGIPFLDWGGKYVSSGSLYNPNLITLGNSQNAFGWHPLSWQDIIDNIHSTPLTTVGQAILGAANIYTAAICKMTGSQPASVCSLPAVQQALKLLPKS
jgi:hypothetical protein